VPNNFTIRLNRLIERKYKRTTNERTMVTEQNPHLVLRGAQGCQNSGTARGQ